MRLARDPNKPPQWAKKDGCDLRWYDGIFGESWHCFCDNNRHCCDQQCSAVTEKKNG